MEDKIINILDNLTPKQTQELLDENVQTKINAKTHNRIKNSVFDKAEFKEKKRIYISKKLVACAAAFAIIFTTMFFVGFDNVAAAIKSLFTFVPGIGVTEKIDDTIYAVDLIVGQTKTDNAKANIVNAVYAGGYLNVTVEVVGKELYHDGFIFFVNEEQTSYRDERFNNGYALSVASDSTMLSFSFKTATPKEEDTYRVSVSGFGEDLAFRMIPCLVYDDIKHIGPTDTQNKISVITTAQRFDNQLTVWCYPFKAEGATKDTILGYGQPANGAFELQRYIKTESGQVVYTGGGWQVQNRLVFEMPEEEETATLHIPYLAMQRDEKTKLTMNLPSDYTTIDDSSSAKTDLGTIKVTQVIREAKQNDKDMVRIYFEFESIDANTRLYSFYYDNNKYLDSVRHFDGETGCLDYLELYVDKGVTKLSLDISQLYYYMLGEYVIPLDIR